MEIGIWVLFGIAIGIVAYYLDQKPKNLNRAISVILGVLGATMGGIFSYSLFGTKNLFNLTSLGVIASGALIVLLIGRILKTR